MANIYEWTFSERIMNKNKQYVCLIYNVLSMYFSFFDVFTYSNNNICRKTIRSTWTISNGYDKAET